ncbi:hypothetical protein IV203_028444 [Nitzschia inconspicua]|uniref:Uncharacterized protein n=1 Tax=Nitzschia inconspicua TaxID=303405 RepID=A0A9K3Q290_9STRA|nr:hypothetical protein IV203_028444 [Nitzschia inconspicua]
MVSQTSNDEDNNNNNNHDRARDDTLDLLLPPENRKKYSVGRYGGRRQKQQQQQQPATSYTKQMTTLPLSNLIRSLQKSPKVFLAATILALLLSTLLVLGRGNDNRVYYYSYSYSYSSSIVEKPGTNNNSNDNNGDNDNSFLGQPQIRRQESTYFQTNIPNLRLPSTTPNRQKLPTSILQQNQQEEDFMDAFVEDTVRSMERMFDESWE